jgi:hypothetical protein
MSKVILKMKKTGATILATGRMNHQRYQDGRQGIMSCQAVSAYRGGKPSVTDIVHHVKDMTIHLPRLRG